MGREAIHLRVVPRLRMSGALTSLAHMPSWPARRTTTFYCVAIPNVAATGN